MAEKKKKKRTLLEAINPFDKESKERRAARKRTRIGKKAIKAGERIKAGKAAKGTGLLSTKKSRAKSIGAKVTKGGAYAKYKKGSKAAKSFGATRKAACGGGEGGTFSWDGRSYSCAVAKPTKKQKAARKASALPGGTKKPTAHT